MIIVEVSTTPPDEPNAPTFPPPAPHLHNRYVLTGVDGSTWDLCDGPVWLTEGATGFGLAKPEHRWKSSPAVDGAVWGGSRTPERTLTLPLSIEASESMEWLDIYDAFFDAIDPAGECTLTVVRPDRIQRSLLVRYDDGADVEIDVDPLLRRSALYPLSFVAGDPYWAGFPIARAFQLGEESNLFPGPPFHINPSNVLGSATVTNPGDVDAWPIWEIVGPFGGFSVGLGASSVAYSGPVAAGETIVIDTTPRMRTIRDGDGVDRWAGATEVDFQPIPPGEHVDLSLTLTGANADTRIRLEFTPRYRRAW